MKVISSYVRITDEAFSIDGNLLLEKKEDLEVSWPKQLYNFLELDYSKFYKMDRLAQLGFLATEGIKKTNPVVTQYKDDEVALLFANSESSADTDERFEKSYVVDGVPSPSLFVYTLPNIVLGEIAIRNKWYGENMFFVFPKFNPSFFVEYARILGTKGAKAVVGGWVSLAGNTVDAFLFLMENEGEGIELSKDNLELLYRNSNKL